MGLFKVVVSALFPNTCVCCGEIIPEGEYLCEYCDEMSEKVDFTKNCSVCGLLKKECQCNKRVFHFNGCTAPFYNTGVMQKAMYAYKFARKEHISKFFAERMAISVKCCFSEVDFDIVTFVPTSLRRKMKRGFNQSEVLAKDVSKILNVKFANNLLIYKNVNDVQHYLGFEQRFENVKGKFLPNKKVSLNGKTVLLVDDIKTTGATLDECARQLLILGADKVYCVTGLMTVKNKKKEGK